MKRNSLNIAALTLEIDNAGPRVQLFPAGRFSAADGTSRSWYIDAAIAQRLIDAARNQANDYAFDYEHQTRNTLQNGQPAPAAGWFKTLEWVDGVGLFATDVRWTERARAMIEAKEYRYVSPMFRHDKAGNVVRLLNAAITNLPALDGMTELVAASFLSGEENPMDEELLAALCALFGLAAGATEDELKTKVTGLLDTVLKPAACSTLSDLLSKKDGEIASLSATAPDPKKYVPVSAMKAMQDQLAALNTRVNDDEVNGLVTVALSDGRLLADMEDWARELGRKDVAALRGYLEKARPIPALKKTQTGGKAPAGVAERDVMDESALAICSMFGNDAKEIATSLAQEEQQS
ncbi:hypothetical protein M942_04515 [Enterobacter ludwigii]|uniref:phage protease n=1 Tax=Enterobacter ludwigii TaxID=299767 RepID=UPI0003D8F4D0|nr:phage protease [Enterobacter ludwigii]AHE72556.1 hypothetical protein M942_04515 [Enterobacter ludwigii]